MPVNVRRLGDTVFIPHPFQPVVPNSPPDMRLSYAVITLHTQQMVDEYNRTGTLLQEEP